MPTLTRLRRAALADPIADWYAGTARTVLFGVAGISGVVCVLVLANASTLAETKPDPNRAPTPLWILLLGLVLITATICDLTLRGAKLIRTSSPQANWQLFPAMWSVEWKLFMSFVSGGVTAVGLGLLAALSIALATAMAPEWLVGAVALAVSVVTIWGAIVVGCRYHADLETVARPELDPALGEQATQLQQALKSAVAQFESVRAELGEHYKTLAGLQAEVERNRQAAEDTKEQVKAQKVLERRGRWRSLIEGALIGVALTVVVEIVINIDVLREHLPPWMVLFR
jgi:hypothetical protein